MASPLTLLMPLKEGISLTEAIGLLQSHNEGIDKALESIGTVHFARFVLLDRSSPTLQPSATGTGPYVLGVITEFDGDFEIYVQDFVDQIGDIFDALLSHTSDGAHLVPVSKNVAAFNAYVASHDLAQMPNAPGLFSAYDLSVNTIIANSKSKR
ncbi:MAG TPA: hypothetical protein VD886_00295 [Herpetosiphonaceae bacterium]|nr:hypothetical protein [Herpetosiphonaceae bacterium]